MYRRIFILSSAVAAALALALPAGSFSCTDDPAAIVASATVVDRGAGWGPTDLWEYTLSDSSTVDVNGATRSDADAAVLAWLTSQINGTCVPAAPPATPAPAPPTGTTTTTATTTPTTAPAPLDYNAAAAALVAQSTLTFEPNGEWELGSIPTMPNSTVDFEASSLADATAKATAYLASLLAAGTIAAAAPAAPQGALTSSSSTTAATAGALPSSFEHTQIIPRGENWGAVPVWTITLPDGSTVDIAADTRIAALLSAYAYYQGQTVARVPGTATAF